MKKKLKLFWSKHVEENKDFNFSLPAQKKKNPDIMVKTRLKQLHILGTVLKKYRRILSLR